MNKLFCVLAILMLNILVPQIASANCERDPLFMSSCPGDYIVGVDFLWWKPCIDDIDFAGTTTTTTTMDVPILTDVHIHYKGICPDWRPGVRLTFDYPNLITWCNIGIRASYTYLDMEQKRTVHGPNNVNLILYPGFVEQEVGANPIFGKWYMKYQTWDTMVYFNCCFDYLRITPSIGVAGIVLNEELKTFCITTIPGYPPITDVAAEVKWKSIVRGVGIKSGIDLNYYYNRCLSFYGFANGSLFAARTHTKNKQDYSFTLAETKLTLKDDNCTRCVPGFHLGVGAQANYCICGFPIFIRAGYEFLQWYNIPKHRIFISDNEGGNIAYSASTTRTLGFNGPFLGLDLSF